MQTPKELSQEIAEFCRESVDQQPKRKVIQAGIGKAVFHGIMLALFVAAVPAGSGNTPARGNPWVVGT